MSISNREAKIEPCSAPAAHCAGTRRGAVPDGSASADRATPAAGGSKTYEFIPVSACNMCGYPADRSRVLGKRLDRPQGFRPVGKAGICTSVQRCGQCGLIFANPLPRPVSLDQHYGTPPESYWKSEYFRLEPDYLHGQVRRFTQLRGDEIAGRGLSALDVGAGIGKGMVALAAAGFDTWGIEPSAEFRRRAIDRMAIAPERIQLAAVEDATYADNTFDFILFAAVLEHVYDPAGVLERAMRWLKPGGLMHVEVPSSAYLSSAMMRLFYRVTGSDYVTNICPMHVPYHLYEFTPASFERHGAAAGYQIAFHEYYPCTAYAPRWLDPLLVRVMEWTHTGMQLAIWLETPQPAEPYQRA